MAKKRTTRKKTTRKVARKPARKAAKKTAKKTARKTVRKTARKTTRKTAKKATAKKPGKLTAARKPRSKSEIFSIISEQTELSKKDVAAVFDTLGHIIKTDLAKNGPGAINIPGMMKILVQNKKAVPRRKGVNPFTGVEQWFKAKPARRVVKVRPLKALKDMV